MTIDEKISSTNVKSPPGWLYWILMKVTAILNRLSNTHFRYRARPSEERGPIVMIANHASRVDYQFTAPPCYPKKLNYVVGYNEFFRFPTNLLLPTMQVIPKKNFTPDAHALRQILRVIASCGSICLMPEGMSSITGMAQPVIPGGAKLLKKLGVPVYYSKISGGYLTYTKHCLDERKGRIDVVVDRMFTPEQLGAMSVEEIEDTMNRLLAHDDYMWNRKAHVAFDGKGQMAKKLDTLLYLCPKCGAKYEMDCAGNTMTCRKCGNSVELDEYYQLHPVGDSVCPELVRDWTILERERAAEEVRFGSVTTGASNDIEQATKLARAMVTRYGMSTDFDMVALETVTNQYLGGDASLACSAETQTKIDALVVALVKREHEKAVKLLNDHRSKLDELSKYLYEKETITGEEFMKILNLEKAQDKTQD